MQIVKRALRHGRISWKAMNLFGAPGPSFLIFFVTSRCNLKCDHCFYWKNLNHDDDLTLEEIRALSQEMGRIENLNLSGGEPFLRKEIAEICSCFIQNNKVEQIYIPTNAYFAKRTVDAVCKVLEEEYLKLLAIEISLDGMPEYHNRMRGSKNSFEKAMETYDALEKVQRSNERLRIHAVSTVTAENMDEVEALTTYLYERCPAMDHHNIALIRGDRKKQSLQGPDLEAYEALHRRVRQIWAPREEGRFGGIVEPMLQWAKVRTAKEQRQVVPCRAGILSAVVYANGDVSFCESLPPVGNLRERGFGEIWSSGEAVRQRSSIGRKNCYCTNEIFLWPSITFQPVPLANAMMRSGAWKGDRGQGDGRGLTAARRKRG